MLYIFIALFIGLIFFLNRLSKKKVKFMYRNLIAVALGLFFGLIVYFGLSVISDNAQAYTEFSYYLRIVSDTYIRLLRMMVVPIVFISISTTIMNLESGKAISKAFRRIIFYFVITVAIASILALAFALMFNLKSIVTGLSLGEIDPSIIDKMEIVGEASLGAILHGLILNIPTSIAQAFAENNIVGTLIVATFVGYAVKFMYLKKPTEIEPIKNGLEGLKLIINSIVMTIIKLTPYGIFALMTRAVAEKGPQIFTDFAVFILAAYLCMAVIVILHTLAVAMVGVNPIKHIKNLGPVLITGFSTQSSASTLPLTIEALEDECKVETGVANLGPTLGTTMGMGACGGMWPTLMIVLAIALTNIVNPGAIPINITTIILIVLSTIVASFGIAGVPGTGTFAAITAMTIFGIDPVIQGVVLTFILPIEPLVDMGRTATNIYGVASGTVIAAKTTGLIREEDE